MIANLGNDEPDTKTVALVGDATGQAVMIEQLGQAAGVQLETITVPDEAAAEAALHNGDADVVVSADGTTLTTEKEVDLSESSSLADTVNVLRSYLALQNGLPAAGLSPEQAAAVQSAEPPAVDALEPQQADAVDPSRIGVALVINILLFIMLQTYGQWVVTAVTHKSLTAWSRCSSRSSALGSCSWASSSVSASLRSVTPPCSSPSGSARSGSWAWRSVPASVSATSPSPAPGSSSATRSTADAYAAAGSLVSRVEDAQTVAFPIMLPLLLGYIVSFSAAGGASLLLWILAFFPPTAVLAMPTLYAVGEAPLWAVFVSMALTAVAVVVVALVAAKIYERSVLRTGKKLSWRAAIRLHDEIGHVDTLTTTA